MSASNYLWFGYILTFTFFQYSSWISSTEARILPKSIMAEDLKFRVPNSFAPRYHHKNKLINSKDKAETTTLKEDIKLTLSLINSTTQREKDHPSKSKKHLRRQFHSKVQKTQETPLAPIPERQTQVLMTDDRERGHEVTPVGQNHSDNNSTNNKQNKPQQKAHGLNNDYVRTEISLENDLNKEVLSSDVDDIEIPAKFFKIPESDDELRSVLNEMKNFHPCKVKYHVPKIREMLLLNDEKKGDHLKSGPKYLIRLCHNHLRKLKKHKNKVIKKSRVWSASKNGTYIIPYRVNHRTPNKYQLKAETKNKTNTFMQLNNNLNQDKTNGSYVQQVLHQTKREKIQNTSTISTNDKNKIPSTETNSPFENISYSCSMATKPLALLLVEKSKLHFTVTNKQLLLLIKSSTDHIIEGEKNCWQLQALKAVLKLEEEVSIRNTFTNYSLRDVALSHSSGINQSAFIASPQAVKTMINRSSNDAEAASLLINASSDKLPLSDNRNNLGDIICPLVKELVQCKGYRLGLDGDISGFINQINQSPNGALTNKRQRNRITDPNQLQYFDRWGALEKDLHFDWETDMLFY